MSEQSIGVAAIARKLIKGTIGILVIALGIVMLVTPGPGIVAILIGLSILASEFPTARRLLDRLRRRSAESDG